MIADREVALRLARDRNLDRKLRVSSGSKYFWIYSLSLWEPDAFWRCVSEASAFATVGLIFASVVRGGFSPLIATTAFEYFLLGLVVAWVFNLGPWLQPTNLAVIFTFIFRLYRKHKTVDDLSAEEIGRMFPHRISAGKGDGTLVRIFVRIRQSPILGSLFLGSCFAAFLLALLLVSS